MTSAMREGKARDVTPQRRFGFPDVPGPKLNLGCGYDVRPASAGWVNVDAYNRAPDVLPMDLTETPWKFADDSFDLVYASHVLEHVPLDFRMHASGARRDILFDVMEEVWRVLRPGRPLVMRVPWGGSHPGVIHVQHYRQWRPEWLYYFEPEHGEHAMTTAAFRVASWIRTRETVAPVLPYWWRMGPKKLPLTTHLRDRFGFLRPLLERPAELEAWLVKLPRS
jgi:predicted SAM-dependent methyltransferase